MTEPTADTPYIRVADIPEMPMIVLVPTRSTRFSMDGYHSKLLNRGEAQSFTLAEAEYLQSRRIALPPGESLDPPPPDATPRKIRLLTGVVIGFAFRGTGERVTAPAYTADRLIRVGAAVLDDGQPDPPAVVSNVRNAVRRRVAAILEMYR